jgi:hypothetical protein
MILKVSEEVREGKDLFMTLIAKRRIVRSVEERAQLSWRHVSVAEAATSLRLSTTSEDKLRLPDTDQLQWHKITDNENGMMNDFFILFQLQRIGLILSSRAASK